MPARRTNPDFLNGVPELLLLRLLSRRPMYGYELVHSLRAATHGELEFGEGCIYPILHRLEAEKLLSSRRDTVGGRVRLVYKTTPAGIRRLSESITVWKRITQSIAAALQDDHDASVQLA